MEIITTDQLEKIKVTYNKEGLAEKIELENLEEIKAAAKEKAAEYAAIVYDDDQIKAAKKDKAELNKAIKGLEDTKKKVKAQCLAPYEAFEKQIKEVAEIVQQPVAIIDQQVKAYETKQKEAKLEEIKAYYATKDLQGIEPGRLADPKWLNASVSMNAIKSEIDKQAEEIAADMAIINDLEAYQFEAIETYKNTRDIRAAISKAKELQEAAKRKAEWEAAKKAQEEAQADAVEEIKAEEETAPEIATDEATEDDDFIPDFDSIPDNRHWVTIKAFLTDAQHNALEVFLREMGAQHETI